MFQGLASASVTKRFEPVLPFSNPCLCSSFEFESNFIDALIHGDRLYPHPIGETVGAGCMRFQRNLLGLGA